MSTISCWKAFVFMIENDFVESGPQDRVDTMG